jgi:ATP-dependent Clp protease protease subunit
MSEQPQKNSPEDFLTLMEGVPPFIDYAYWSNLQNRKIIFNDEVNVHVVERIMMQILRFNEEDKDIPAEQRKPIEIYIHSGGGDVFTGLSLLSIIEKSITPVHTYVLGIAGSMAGLIYMAGHRRFAYENSIILIHDGSLSLQSSSKKAKQIMEFYDEVDSVIKRFILKQTKITEEIYEEKCTEEFFMFAPKAKELGIVDEII